MDELSDELEALQTELTALGLKQDKMQDQIDQVNTRLQTVESLEKQLGKVETGYSLATSGKHCSKPWELNLT